MISINIILLVLSFLLSGIAVYYLATAYIGVSIPIRKAYLPLIILAAVSFISRISFHISAAINTIVVLLFLILTLCIINRINILISLAGSILSFITVACGNWIIMKPLLTKMGFEYIINPHNTNWIYLSYTEQIIPFISIVFLKVTNISLNKIINHKRNELDVNINSKSLLCLFLVLLVGIFITLVCQLYFFEAKSQYLQEISFFIFLLWVSSIYFFNQFNSLLYREKIAKEADRLYLEESQRLIQTLRSQSHDFNNMLQVIMVLVKMNKNEETVKYILDYNQASSLSNSVPLQIQSPIISAMILSFATEAKAKGITFTFNCELNYYYFNISPIKITRILGNIIKNAIEIIGETNSTEKIIIVTLKETNSCYIFSVWNNGPAIPEDTKEQIFDAGFSTKRSTGLGLSIVKELTGELKGKVSVTSSTQSGTDFRVIIPKDLKAGLVLK